MLHQVSLAYSPIAAMRPIVRAGLNPVGFAPGTMIDTPDGRAPIESLMAGDKILTAAGDIVELRGTSQIEAHGIDVVRISPAGLGDVTKRPNRDLVLPVSQPVQMADWRAKVVSGADTMLTEAGSLVDGVLVTRETRASIVLTRLHFDTPQVVLADGLPVGNTRVRVASVATAH